jgi:drug/metabolite transporter (DMT)-like permease
MKFWIFGFLCLVWGTTWIALKVSLEGLPPFLGAGLRFTAAVVILLLFVLLKKIPLKIKPKEWGFIALSGLLMYGVDYGLVYWGAQYLTAGLTAIFFSTFSLFAVIWGNFVFRQEAFSWQTFIGVVIGFAGILVVFSDQLVITRFSLNVTLGVAAVIVGAAAGAAALILVKKYLSKVNPFLLSLYQMVIGVSVLIFIGLTVENLHLLRLNLRVTAAVLYLGVVGSALAFVLFYWLLQKISAITLSFIIYITPLVALVGDYLFFGEVLPLRSVLGMAVVFLGVGLTQKRKKRAAGKRGDPIPSGRVL